MHIYFILINIISFFTMMIDKYKAIKNKWRISEKTLFILAIIGGSIGSIAGMYIFRHKTSKWYFKFGLPVIVLIQIIIYLNVK